MGIEDFRDPVNVLDETKKYLEEIMGSPTFNSLGDKFPEVKALLTSKESIDEIIADTELNSRQKIFSAIQQLKNIITTISTAQAASPIETLLFTEAMSKLFLDVNTCNLGANRVPPEFNFGQIKGRGGGNAIANKSSKKRTQKKRK